MKFNKLTLATSTVMSIFVISAHANEVQLIVNKPMEVVYRLAYQDQGKNPVLSEPMTISINENYTIPVDLNNHLAAGIVIDSVAGHVLPDTAKQFNKPEQCSLATDANMRMGKLTLTSDKKVINCRRD